MEDLIERLKRATKSDYELDVDIAVACSGRWPTRRSNARGKYVTIYEDGRTGVSRAPAYTNSIDTALTLVPEGMEWHISNKGQIGASHLAFAGVYGAPMLGSECDTNASTPAIAICIAALEARLALSTTGASREQT